MRSLTLSERYFVLCDVGFVGDDDKHTLALAGAEKHSKARGFGEDCLRAKPEFRSRRALRASQGTPEGHRSGLGFRVKGALPRQSILPARRAETASNYAPQAHKT